MLTHGTRYAYNRGGCRCEPCTAANTDYYRKWRAAADPSYIRHGVASSYRNYGCRCDRCTAAASASTRDHRAKAKARAQ